MNQRKIVQCVPTNKPIGILTSGFSGAPSISRSAATEWNGFAKIGKLLLTFAPLAQLDRASDYESEGREFESLRARHLFSHLPFLLAACLVVVAVHGCNSSNPGSPQPTRLLPIIAWRNVPIDN